MLINVLLNKKHIDASVKERPQTLLVNSEEIYKRDLCNKHIYIVTPFISNRTILFVHKDNAFCKFHTFFGVVYHELKQKIESDVLMLRSMHLHRNLPESEKYIWIIQIWKVSILLY